MTDPISRIVGILATVCVMHSADLHAQSSFPQDSISNGSISLRVYLPDSNNGYYRGTRFDWSAVMPALSANGHQYCAVWFNNYQPTLHDAIMGPVESFWPLNYANTAAGEAFVQIGVGLLKKTPDTTYSPFRYYPILQHGEWTIRHRARQLSFAHQLQGAEYGYRYKKILRLAKHATKLFIQHRLQNNGTSTIETDVYNHNLFVFDGLPTGAGYSITFPFTPMPRAAEQRGLGDNGIAIVSGCQILFKRTPVPGTSLYAVLDGYGNSARDYDIRIENHHTGAAMRITCDRPLSKLVCWGSARIFSPEPYIHLSIPPGKTASWTITYELYTCAIDE